MSSSRVIIKNLPKYATEESIRKFLKDVNNITDLRLVRSANGASRRFCFVGFYSEEDAKQFIDNFHRAYYDRTELAVEYAYQRDDPNLPRGWSRYTPGSTAFLNQNKELQDKLKEQRKEERDKKKKEQWEDILRSKGVLIDETKQSSAISVNEFISAVSENDRRWEDGLVESSMNLDEVKKREPELEEEKEEEKKQTKEKDEVKSKQKTKLKRGQRAPRSEANFKEISAKEGDALVRKTGRVFMRNLTFFVKNDDISKLVSPYGEIEEIHLPLDKLTNKPVGTCYVKFVNPLDALNFFKQNDGITFLGRNLHILPAYDNEKTVTNAKVNKKVESMGYKTMKLQQLQKSAENSYNWNAFFIRLDTAISAAAKELSVEKSDILDVNDDSIAVRAALIETEEIRSVKEYLRKNGVNLKSFEEYYEEKAKNRNTLNRIPLSKTTLIIKNLSHLVTEGNLREKFSPFGDILKLILSPHNSIAIVQFSHENAAKSCFRRLAYVDYYDQPLFIQYAPENVFSLPKNDDIRSKNINIVENKKVDSTSLLNKSKTIHIKGISKDATDQYIREVFEQKFKVKYVTVPRKPNGQTRGFAFVEFATAEDAQSALRIFDGVEIEGRAIQLTMSSPSGQANPESTSSSSLTDNVAATKKLIIKNVPFEATKKDLQMILSSYGELKTLRIPKKFDGTSRGIAFAEFLTKDEAEQARIALQSTRLLNRRLIVDYAET
eukprot:TRINITY_DN3149_c6_g6_i1.p1 TRINITY_DN3149_c6_g6~~TRINITY_DN3149_c6_g6_i1.p1  ORF type:complete len:721 (-),score=229.56 TRINITY_DN3149_c6_g6_i1:116-2278(-)